MYDVDLFPDLSITYPMLSEPIISPNPKLIIASIDFISYSCGLPTTVSDMESTNSPVYIAREIPDHNISGAMHNIRLSVSSYSVYFISLVIPYQLLSYVRVVSVSSRPVEASDSDSSGLSSGSLSM